MLLLSVCLSVWWSPSAPGCGFVSQTGGAAGGGGVSRTKSLLGSLDFMFHSKGGWRGGAQSSGEASSSGEVGVVKET